MPSADEQFDALVADAAEVAPREELREKLRRSEREGRPLRAKLGIDPSRPDLHLGHTAVLIVGDFTGLVGDPSGQSETRPMLTSEEMAENARTYFEQAGLVVDVEGAEVHGNSEWLSKLSMPDVLRLTSTTTVAQMLERDDFQARYREGRPISVVEFLYPLMQAMDSVATRADVELGGTDQTFNLLMGREIQRAYGQEPQVVVTTPLLQGTDGRRKMSKSFDNFVGLTEPPKEMFGKLMSIPDELVVPYFQLLTHHDEEQLRSLTERVAAGGAHAAEAKRRLAREIVSMYHGEGSGRAAEERFDAVHKRHELPEDIVEMEVPPALRLEAKVWLPRLLHELGLVGSNSEGRRRIEQGAVRIDGEPVTDPGAELDTASIAGRVIQIGRRRFVRLR